MKRNKFHFQREKWMRITTKRHHMTNEKSLMFIIVIKTNSKHNIASTEPNFIPRTDFTCADIFSSVHCILLSFNVNFMDGNIYDAHQSKNKNSKNRKFDCEILGKTIYCLFHSHNTNHDEYSVRGEISSNDITATDSKNSNLNISN